MNHELVLKKIVHKPAKLSINLILGEIIFLSMGQKNDLR